MKPVSCEFEADVLAAAVQSRWPERVDAELRAHVAQCEICSDVAAVAGAMEELRETTRAAAAVPDSGRVWWLAQLRARREAAAVAGRPITAAQVMAFGCAAGLAGACFGATSTWFQAALRWIVASLAGFDLKPLVPSPAFWAGHGVVLASVAAVLLLVPAAVYLAIRRE